MKIVNTVLVFLAFREVIIIVKMVFEEDFVQNVLKSENPVIVDFFAKWCAPCKLLSSVVEELAKKNPDVEFYKTDVDENHQLAATYQINAIPTLLVFKGGDCIDKMVGYNSMEAIQALIDKAR